MVDYLDDASSSGSFYAGRWKQQVQGNSETDQPIWGRFRFKLEQQDQLLEVYLLMPLP